FTELSPHPLLTHAVDQTARSLSMSAAALAAMRREQPLPHGLRELVGDLYAAGAAVDFAQLYPAGRLVETPLPAWTHRRLLLEESTDRLAHANTVAVHPLLGAHVRLPEEPERHVWQGDVGTEAQPWLGDHQIRGAAALPGAAYCEMALAAARTMFGENAEVRDVRFERLLLLDGVSPVAATATVEAPGVVPFVVETTEGGERSRRASAMLHAGPDGDTAEQPPAAHDIAALLASHTDPAEGDDLRHQFDIRGIQYGPAFSGLTAAHITGKAGDTVLAEVAVPSSIRAQQGAYGVHPALLDACFQSVSAHPSVAGAGGGGLLLPLGVRRLRAFGPARHARHCLTTVTPEGTGLSADIDILDEHGTVLVTVRGLQMGTGASPGSERDRLLAERLLTIEWHQRDLPDKAVTDPGHWLLITTSEAADMMAAQLTDALKMHDADSATISWLLRDDHDAQAGALRDRLSANAFDGVVVLTAPRNGDSEAGSPVDRGREYVEHIVRIARELPDIEGQTARLYVMTRNAQTVLADDCANLEQGGLRGLLRVISAEHPHLKVTYIDVDEHTGAEQVSRQLLLTESGEDETAWRNDEWYTARLSPTPLGPDERQTTVVEHVNQGMRLQIRTPGDLQTLEFAAFERVAPGPGEVEVAVGASSINFADVLVTFGRYQTADGQQPQLGADFAGVVTAVGPDVTDLKVGDRVGGLSASGCWATFVTCDARLATPIPDGLTDAQAAAVTTASATAWYGLHDLARIRSGDKVLIHSATGGVGQAAIAIARAAGA
ncbi:MAG: polyketide synthase dehydratase domain-containing protein, partial [Mycobacteriaceae bacterium]|nr:polyketide synthase dehydratase domain-containing protein [Mycobacteriaceae bacterium]